MKKIFLFGWFFLLCLTFGHAQNTTSVQTFKPLLSEGEFPAFLNEVMAASPKDNIYNVFLKNLVSEGKILYGTELNRYIDNIADQLLAQYPDLRKEIDIYILEVPEVNAYSLKNGTILINMGLLAQVTNEAELAFILAHEIAHYSEKHGTLKDKGNSKNKDFVTDYLETHQFSREQEFAADRVGLTQYFKNSPYSLDVLDGIFDVLLYAYLPFDEIPFERSEVETDFYTFPDNYFLKSVARISDRSTVVDTFLTHPNIEKRRTAAKALVKGFPNENRKTFVQPEEDFVRMRDLARFSCIEYYLNKHKYDRAIYNIHVLEQQFPNNKYLEQAKVTAYFGVAKHKGDGTVNSILKPYREVEGNMQQVSYFLSKATKLESALLALRKAWTTSQKYPEDTYLENVVKDLIFDLFVSQKKKYTDFCDYPQGTKLEDITDTVASDSKVPGNKTPENKYDRIKQQNQYNKVLPNPKFKTANYMLVDIHRDSLFYTMVDDAILNADALDLLENISGRNIGDEKNLIVIEPGYRIYNNSSKLEAKSKRHAANLQKMIARSTKRMGINPVTFKVEKNRPLDTKSYNEIARMYRLYDDIGYGEGVDMRCHSAQYIEDIISSVGTKMCCVNVVRDNHSWFAFNKLYLMLATVLCPYVLPAAVAECSFMKYDTGVNFYIVDIEKGKFEVMSGYGQTAPISRAYVDGFVYSQLEKYIKKGKR
jgi:hypothetical protein